MCELLGLSSSKPVSVQKYLDKFYAHSIHHPHGWGLMREKNGEQEIIKEPACAIGSRIINKTIHGTEPQTNMLAHIRFATVGGTKSTNCHPYSGKDKEGRTWTLIHNGTIYSGTQLSKYLSVQTGDTDSERIFLYMMDEINNAITDSSERLSADERFRIVSKLAEELSPRNKLNFMIYDEEFLYIHKNMRNTMVYKNIDGGYIFSTVPLDDDDWQSVPMTQVIAFRDGERVFVGKKHDSEFVPTLEYITAMDAMNI